jgi:p-hydroxybenzoate 3-monooxygenase
VLEAELLAEALVDDLVHGNRAGLTRYSERCLAHVWRAQEFSQWMIRLLHAAPGPDDASLSHNSLRRSRIEALRASRSRQHWFAEHYVGV